MTVRHTPKLQSRRNILRSLISLPPCALMPALVLADSRQALVPSQTIAAVVDPLRAAGLPGAVIGIMDTNGQRQVSAIGVANIDNRAPIRRSHVFRIGSIAKTLVGHLTLKMIGAGAIDLQSPIAQWMDDIPGADRITVDDLLRHRSGLVNLIADPAFRARINAHPEHHFSQAEILALIRASRLNQAPSASFSYSNSNTVVLAALLERTSGTDLNALLADQLLQVLGLHRPTLPFGHELPFADLRGYRFGPRKGGVEYGVHFFDATHFSASWAGAAGNMNAGIDDLLTLAHPMAQGQGLSKTMAESRLSFEQITDGFEYGAHIVRFRGRAIGHAGDVPGFSSFMAWDPVTQCSVAVLCNLSNMADRRAPAEQIGLDIIEALG